MEIKRRHVLGLTTLGAATALYQFISGASSSDADMIAWFDQKESIFSELLAMARAEKTVRRIAYDFLRTETDILYEDSLPLGFTMQKWQTYKTIFSALDLDMGIEFWGRDVVYFYYDTMGIVPSGFSKGYVWSQHRQEPLVERLDHPLSPKGYIGDSDYIGFKMIKPNWYLFLKMT